MVIFNIILKFGLVCFVFLWGAQIILKEDFIENYIYVYEPEECELEVIKNWTPLFDGFFQTFFSCLIPVFNVIYIAYFLIMGLTKNEEKLFELREIMRELKNER